MKRTGFSVSMIPILITSLFLSAIPPASACTGLVLEGEDGTVLYGRTQEWSGFDLHTEAVIYPKNRSFRASTPDGENGIPWESKYGFLGFVLLDRVVNDGMNEKGLAGGQFYHEGFAEYAEYDPALADKSMSPSDVLPYILSNFSTVDEVREGMKDIRVVPVIDPSINKAPPVHFLIAEPSGASLVIEFKGGKAKFYDNPVGVITNNPTFDWHLQNLRNYGYITIEPFKDKTWANLKITPLASGSGLLGLPGDYTAPSRFVRAVVLKEISFPTKGGMDTVNQFFRIMDSFNVPSSQGEGNRSKQGHGTPPLPSDTQWTVAHNTTDLITYYHTMFNRLVRKIDLNSIDFKREGLRKMPLDEERAQTVKNVTNALKKSKEQ
jgi:choloylglycine hydrolase